ncbi:magnesium transporter MRS2-A, chloroplastic [Phragmites australis]|uniref:magnesium transporter MRS2-A, chloroplastic n=1 Tax=Phragmites australis TaxID=29695 RepID=UPI002D7A013F|nr:magnesium transporter MRS2-A, chloroplastic [Phragmites australis]
MASVSLSASSQAGLLLLPLPLLHPAAAAAGACLRYRVPRLPPLGLSSVRKGALLPLPAPRAAEGKDGRAVTKEEEVVEEEEVRKDGEEERGVGGGEAREEAAKGSGRFAADYISLGIREPVYEVIEVRSNARVSTKKISRRQLLKSSGLRLRDTRSVDPSLWLMNSMPSLLVREQAILVNLGSLRAIAMHERVLIFNYNSPGGKAFLESLLPRLNPRNINGGPAMPFQLEVVEAALLSRIQRLEQRLMNIEPRVAALLEVLPNRLTANVLEQLRLSKQALVELGSRAGDLKQMLIDLLEDPHEIRRICIMGRNCTLDKLSDDMECSVPLEKQIAEEEEEEIEMLLENYLQRCESCHGQAERLLDSAREMEDSIAVNLSSRRLEVSRVELLLQVGTFCVAVGALVAGIFGMNLKSYLEMNAWAFWATTGGIVVGAVAGFFLMYSYLKARKIL